MQPHSRPSQSLHLPSPNTCLSGCRDHRRLISQRVEKCHHAFLYARWSHFMCCASLAAWWKTGGIHGVGTFDFGACSPHFRPQGWSLGNQALLILDLQRVSNTKQNKLLGLHKTGKLHKTQNNYILSAELMILTMHAACTASETIPASGSHQNTWHSKRCVPASTMTAKVWVSWPTPRKVRYRTWHSQNGSSPS